MAAAWLFYTFGDDRQYGGNEGYADELETVYRYSSRVPNRKKIQEGDLVVLCGPDAVAGVATIARIQTSQGIGEQLRCPHPGCGDPHIKPRKHKVPRYKCRHGHEFDEPVRETRPETVYAAHFGDTFRAADGRVTREQARSFSTTPTAQLAMRRLDDSRLDELLRLVSPGPPRKRTPDPESSGAGDPGEFVPSGEDSRLSVEAQIRIRRGQAAFREALRRQFGNRCAVSGCAVVALLEAAHISPYRGDQDHNPENGLLLRADLHTLFDLGLLGIDPDSLEVRIDPSIHDPDYRKLDGVRLARPISGSTSRLALRVRWQVFLDRDSIRDLSSA